MTLYWWTHWFWITSTVTILTVVLLQAVPTHSRPSSAASAVYEPLQQPEPFQLLQSRAAVSSLNTSPFQTARDEYQRQARRREPLQFPRRAESAASLRDGIDILDTEDEDVEDIFNGHAQIQSASYRELSVRQQELLTIPMQPTKTVQTSASSVSTTSASKADAAAESKSTSTTTTDTPTVTRRTTIVPVEEIIATRLSTRKRPSSSVNVAFADAVDLANVTRVNVTTLIRSTARSNKTSNFITSSSYRNSNSNSNTSSSGNGSASNIIAINSNSASPTSSGGPSSSSSSTRPGSSTSINTSRSDEMLTDDDNDGDTAVGTNTNANGSVSEVDDAASATSDDEDRHNYTNEQQAAVLAVPIGGKVTNEKGVATTSTTTTGGAQRQSKVLAEVQEPQLQQRSSPALEANLPNLTGGPKSLLAELSGPVAMNARAILAEIDGGAAAAALPVKRSAILDAGAISGICIAAVALCGAVSAAGIVLYRRRFVNKPQTLSEPDSSGYIDDSINRDNSDEMYSLDNDSFLNSLEAMTIQNYWTENVKHTKL